MTWIWNDGISRYSTSPRPKPQPISFATETAAGIRSKFFREAKLDGSLASIDLITARICLLESRLPPLFLKLKSCVGFATVQCWGG